MKHHTAEETTNQVHAKSLLADIQGAPDTVLPRREAITEWLNGYLLRSDRRDYVVDPIETNDLAELDKFLRSHEVPVAA
jgi:hypothetical protein